LIIESNKENNRLCVYIQMEIDNFIKTISSPETGKIFFAPMINFKTGHVYEEDCIEILSEDIIVFTQLRSLIIGFLEEFPEYKKNQYLPTNDRKLDFSKNISYFENFTDEKIKHLTRFDNFKMELVSRGLFSKIVGCDMPEIIKHFIDHCDDINYEFKECGWSFLNYVCRDTSKKFPNLVKYVVEKGADITHLCKNDFWSPLLQIVNNTRHIPLIKYAIDKHFEAGLDLNIKTRAKNILLIFIAEQQCVEVISYALEKMIAYEKKIYYGDILIQTIKKRNFTESSLKVILKYIDKLKL